jgi:hypothetical protein
MSPLKRIMGSVAGLSSAVAAITVSGRIVIVLVFGLIAVLALTGTFGPDRCRADAKDVLAILLGRNRPRGAGSSRSKLVARPGTRRARRMIPY